MSAHNGGRAAWDTDVVIVGAGIGGLTAGAYLAAAGRRVVVVDRQSVAGGNATVFTHHGYEFDVGVHYLGDCGPDGTFAQILDPLGIEIRWRELDPDGFDTYKFPDQEFRVPASLARFRERALDAFPGEQAAVAEYFDAVESIDASMTGGAPDGLMRYANSTLGEVLDSVGASARLRSVLCGQHGIYAVPPSRVSMILHAAATMHYMKGAFYPEGGGQVIADALVAAIEAHGGQVILQTPVEQIIVEGGKACGVRLRPPSPLRRRGVPNEIRAPVVLSNADIKRTYLELVGPEQIPDDLVEQVQGYTMALPLFVVYLILDRDLRAEGFPNSNLYVLPDDDIEGVYSLLESGQVPDDPFALATFASLKDPTNTRLCRPGQTNLQVMTIAPRDLSYWGLERGPAEGERYRLNDTYRRRKQELRDSVLRVAERGIPGLRDSIVYEETATPVTHERFTRSSGGTSYGIEATPGQFLMGRPAPTTRISGLFLCGASTMSGHGIVGTMAGGVAAASAILEAPVQEIVAHRLASG
jgi:phytoene dehydrogenase-like protein